MRRALLTLLLAALHLPGLGSTEGGTHPDEATYLSIASEMADRGAWTTAWLEGEPNFYKPPLLYWAQRASFAVLGRTLFAARLPTALCAIALALVAGALARRMATRDGRGIEVEALAALLTLTSLGLLRFGRVAMMDAPFALALTVAAYGAWRGIEERDEWALLWCGVGAGAATLLKGPVGALLVLLPCAAFAALRAPRLLWGRRTLAAAGLGALIALPWFAAALSVHGQTFFDAFFLRENVGKFQVPWTFTAQAGLLGATLLLALPWTFLAASGVPGVRAWREPTVALPLVWIAAVLLVYSVPGIKFPHYVLPCAPFGVLLAVRQAPPGWARGATALLLALVALTLWLGLRLPLPVFAAAGLALCAGFVAAAAVLVARARLTEGAAAFAVASAIAFSVVLPKANPPLLPTEALEAAGDRPLYFYGGNAGLYRFAAGRAVQRAWNVEHLAGSLREGAAVIVSGAEFEALPAEARGPGEPLACWSRLRRRLPASALLEAWVRRDASSLFEPMLLVGRAESPG